MRKQLRFVVIINSFSPCSLNNIGGLAKLGTTCMKYPKKKIFIIGMYKCGTSWLLSALSAHPNILGLKEYDLIRKNVDVLSEGVSLRDPKEIITNLLSSTAYCQLPKSTVETALRKEEPLSEIKDLLDSRRTTSFHVNQPITFLDLEWKAQEVILKSAFKCKNAKRFLADFLNINSIARNDFNTIVLKAADQLPVFAHLNTVFPDDPKVIVIRDGRDAAISALHYRKLMRERGAPWAGPEKDIASLFQDWCKRAKNSYAVAKS